MSTSIHNEKTKRAIALNIRTVLDDYGWTVADLSREVEDVPRNTVYRACQGENMPSVTALEKIAHALEVTVDSLLVE